MQRPKSWHVLGILQVCFGACGIAFGLFALLGPLMVNAMATLAAQSGGNESEQAMAQSVAIMRESFAYNAIHGAIYAAAGIWQIIAGIGLLRFRRGARPLNLAYAWFDIVFIIGSAVGGSIVQATIYAKYPSQPGAELTRNIGIISAIVMSVITLAYPVVLLILLRRDPFAAAPGADDAGYRPDDAANPYRAPGHGGGG